MKKKLFVLVVILFAQANLNSYWQATNISCTGPTNKSGYNGNIADLQYVTITDSHTLHNAGYDYTRFYCDGNNKFNLDIY